MSIPVPARDGRVCPQGGAIVHLTSVDFGPATHTVRQTSSMTPLPMRAGPLAEVMGGPEAREQQRLVAFPKP